MAQLEPPMNHLLLADDNLLFSKASRVGTEEIWNLLETCCDASGQRINRDKSLVLFTKDCPQSIREEVKKTLNVWNESLTEKYPGMTSDVGR